MIRTGLLEQADARRRSTMFGGGAEARKFEPSLGNKTSSFTATEWE